MGTVFTRVAELNGGKWQKYFVYNLSLNMNELRIFGKIIMISRTLDYQLFETVKEERKRKPLSFYSRLKKRHLCREKMIY